MRTTIITMALAAVVTLAGAAETQYGPALEVKLVAIDTGHMPAPSEASVLRAAAAVRAAEMRCSVKGEKLAGQALVVAQQVQKLGQVASSVEILEGLDAMLVDFKKPQDCAQVLASYAVFRRDGYTHSRAVVMGRAMFKFNAEH